MEPRQETSLVNLLWKRQIDTCCNRNAQISCNILRSVILQPRSKFTPVWEKRSQKHVCIGLDRRVYFDNHHLCYYNDGSEGKPHLLYNLKSLGFKSDIGHKILGVLLYHCHILQHPKFPEEKEVCLLVLTADGYLKVLNANTGAILRSVFLSTIISYRYLMWGDYLNTVQLKTTQATSSRHSRVGGANNNSPRLMSIAVFKIHPLELLVCLAIEKPIFGEDIVDATVNEDLLILTRRRGVVSMYSFTWVMENCKVLDVSLDAYIELGREAGGTIRGGAVGSPGFGIPYTVKITECPPLLFSAQTTTSTEISFGGCPLTYLHNGSKEQDKFHLTSLRSRQQVAVLKADNLAFHPDIAEFHFDDYQRLLHINGCTLSCYRLCYVEKTQEHSLSLDYTIDFKNALQRKPSQLPVVSFAGRTIKRRCKFDFNDLYTSAIQDVDYENETDLLYAVVTLPDPSSESNLQCNLYFIDEKRGSIIKTVPLPTWEPDGNNSIYYELDCILHLLRQNNSSTSTCYYYRLGSS